MNIGNSFIGGHYRRWSALSLLLGLLVILPLIVILVQAVLPAGSAWQHLMDTVLSRYIGNTILLVFGVGVLSTIIGVSCAWLVANFEFPLRKVFSWALILPLALPTYISAFTYSALFDITGPVTQFVLLFTDDISAAWFDVLNMPFLILILSLVLYPYVYLSARAAFSLGCSEQLKAARALGAGPFRTFWKVALPMARPAIVAGMVLVCMEVLNDYGAMKYFGINTLTTGIFRAWFDMGDLGSAMKLAAVLLALVALFLGAERWQRGKSKSTMGEIPVERQKLKGFSKALVIGICSIPVLLGAVVPFNKIASDALPRLMKRADSVLASAAWNSVKLGLVAVLVILLVSLIVAFTERWRKDKLSKLVSRSLSLGYVIPGAVIAVGVLLPLGAMDRWMGSGLFFSGSMFILIYAYAVRFLAVGSGPLNAGLQKQAPSLDKAARTLGFGPLATFRKVNFPILRPALASAAILVFIEVLKELPITLILRPFNYDTLATKAFELAGDERLKDASVASLFIVLAGLLPIILLDRSSRK